MIFIFQQLKRRCMRKYIKVEQLENGLCTSVFEELYKFKGKN